jgi:hypothetical protein
MSPWESNRADNKPRESKLQRGGSTKATGAAGTGMNQATKVRGSPIEWTTSHVRINAVWHQTPQGPLEQMNTRGGFKSTLEASYSVHAIELAGVQREEPE